ncbi:enhanced serine sensitivity protein SseB [Flavobacterium sp. NKUCC04_CG]|uniref:enhanced serine sensitivity protein SseB n=1 Tax=Flavobacterium sp. NKUCC04_CG TaxID=2842121 RepID=UPI001C5B4839|nr:enhanced serine sensitivity protein SseB [Flavobacterium sp. NKUCC04_CG]MBW3518551.1 enhanced serine sensitivity protein SseB [Flavobacterium sp. NKUCC04_CG]
MKKTTLSEILEKAGHDAKYREEFYRRFLEESVYVLTQKESDGKKTGSISDLKKLPIVVFPNQVIPVFTELDRIYEQESIRNEVTAVAVNGREFLTMAANSAVVVNPFSAIYKELIPLEISEMLSGSMFDKKSNILKTKQSMAVQIGQPKIYPEELVACLTELFKTQPEVKAAHIGWIYNPVVGDPPHYIFALECATKDMKRITDQAALATRPFVKAEQFVDFMQLDKDGDISRYFYQQTKPFYTSN